MYCTKCGREISDNSANCTYCGAPTSDTTDWGSNSNQYQNVNYQSGPYIQEDTSPLSLGNYMVMLLITMIPVVNIIMLCVWSFGSDSNVNKRNFARAYLIFTLITIVISIFLWGSIISILTLALS